MTSVYVCSSLRAEVFAHVSSVLNKVSKGEKFYRPQKSDVAEMLQTVIDDCKGIETSDELWVIGEFGRDCSWEVGYAMGLGKKVKVFVDDTNHHLVDEDWMYRYGETKGLLEIINL